MSWYTVLTCDITFSRKTYDSRYLVEEDLDEINKIIEGIKQKLHAMAVTTEPQKMFKATDEYANPMDTVTCEFNTVWDSLKEALKEQLELQLLLNNWDKCHDREGYAIHKPNNSAEAFIEGDFIYSKKEARELNEEKNNGKLDC